MAITLQGDGESTFSNSITSTTGNLTLGDGNLVVADGHGIDFSATEGSNASTSLLDDYEEGTWTPTFANGTFTYGGQWGRYVKIGSQVTCHCNLSWTSKSGSGIVSINLPFATGGRTGDRYCATPGYQNGIDLRVSDTVSDLAMSITGSGTSAIEFFVLRDKDTALGSDVNGMNGTGEVQFSLTYEV